MKKLFALVLSLIMLFSFAAAVEHCAVNYLETLYYAIPTEMVASGQMVSGLCIASSVEGAWLNLCVIGATEADMEVGNLILLATMPQAQ